MIKLTDNRNYMAVVEAPFTLKYMLFLSNSKRVIDLSYLSSASLGTILDKAGINKGVNIESAIPKGSRYYIEEVQLTKENKDHIEKINKLFSYKAKEDFFKQTKGLLGKIYEKMKTPDKLKQNRLKVCFGKGAEGK